MACHRSTETSPFLLLFLLGYCLAVIEGELRCYCNQSGCVSTAYMCKSSAGQCFTRVEVRGEVTHQTHGCLDTLDQELRVLCRSGTDIRAVTVKALLDAGGGGGDGGGVSGGASGRSHDPPLLLCCNEHMCNYRDDLSSIVAPKFNSTFRRGGPRGTDQAISSRNPHSQRDEERDLWFKAAVIAVPIAGGFILVLLVLLAVRMLRSDSRRHRRLVQFRRERSLTKSHMYITDHFQFGTKSSTKQHCSLFNEKTTSKITSCGPLYSDKPCYSCSESGCVCSVPSDKIQCRHSGCLHSNCDNCMLERVKSQVTSSSSQTCSSDSDTSCSKVTTCSTPPDKSDIAPHVHAGGSPGTTCSFLTDTTPSGIICGSGNGHRDLSVRIDRTGHPVSHVHRGMEKRLFRDSGDGSISSRIDV